MNQNYIAPLLAVIVLFLIAYVGVEAAGLQILFGIVIPYVAFVVFIVGFIYRIVNWAQSPVPFRIPSTCGQQKSLPWVKHSVFENPSTMFGVIVRMALEILCFRSLFRNTKAKITKGALFFYEMEIWLWLGAIVFHYCFFVVLFRHLRFFTEPVPFLVQLVEKLDGFIQLGLPGIMISGLLLLAAASYLLLRRLFIAQVKYVSLGSDYFPLFLIMGIAVTGILMRYFTRIDVTAAKALAMGLVTFRPTVPEGIGGVFYVHLFMVSTLMAYFPFSKLMHLGGIFFSPTRNLRGNSREIRHENPLEAGIPVEKE
ncbi:MAG: sulfate reduction electron transfer complex DsrMKJOP subunit DsrM [Deltaproteobacteria bacterium]|nr:sulfate reduction electron transfer complex DsrMKJOP subunit DsrM [Deltaproteobacteria bacterium]